LIACAFLSRYELFGDSLKKIVLSNWRIRTLPSKEFSRKFISNYINTLMSGFSARGVGGPCRDGQTEH
jgi:hypothetical protein